MFENYFIFRQQKIEYKPMSGYDATMQQDVLLHFWVIFLSPTSGFRLTFGLNLLPVWAAWAIGAILGQLGNLGLNRKDAQSRSRTQTDQIIKKLFHLSALELFCCFIYREDNQPVLLILRRQLYQCSRRQFY